MNKKIFIKRLSVNSSHLFFGINSYILTSALFIAGILNLPAQNSILDSYLKEFDELKVLKEFRQKEGSELKYPKAYAAFLDFKKQEFSGKKNGTWEKSLIPGPPSVASGECGNIDFETGDLTEWTGSFGDNPGCCATPGFSSNGVNAATNDANARHTIVTGPGLDPCGGFPVVAPPIPGFAAGVYSCRLGNGVSGGKAERMEIVFTPTVANNIFTYQYAAVLEDPGHTQAQQPYFSVKMLDSNGNTIPCTSDTYVPGGNTPGFVNSNCNGVIYKPWTNVSVDLSAQIGNPVTIQFTTTDCTLGGHYGYAYVNCECTPLAVTQQDSLCVGSQVALTAPYEDNNTYDWTGPGGPYAGQIINVSQAGTYIVTMVSSTGCTKVISYDVIEYPTATINAIPDQTICSGATATLAGGIGGAAISGTWSGGTGVFNPNNTSLNCTYSPSIAEIAAGNVILTLTTNDPLGPCPAVSEQMTLTINPQAVVNAGLDQVICTGNVVNLASILSGAANSGTWSGGGGVYNPDNTAPNAIYTPSALEMNAGTVNLTYTTNDPPGPCTSVYDEMIITINQLPTANAGSVQYVCSGSNITLAGSIGGTAVSGTWSGGAGTFSPDNTTLNAVYTPTANEYAADSIELTLTTNDPPGPCTFSSSNVKFHFYHNPVINFSVDFPSGCPIHCVSFTDLTTVGGGDSVVSWDWEFGDGSPTSIIKGPSHCFSDPGFYDIKLTATSNNGCISSLTIPQMIQVFSLPVAEFIPNPNPATVIDPTITFHNQSSADVNYWHWDFGDSITLSPLISSPDHEYPTNASENYLVTLIVRNADDCYDTIAHEIFIGPEFTFFIPNVFTPNGDGINDYFFGSGIGIIKYDMWIFDRWGNMIFHGKELNDKWDGKANGGGKEAQIDVFVWKVTLTDLFNKEHNYIGTVSLVK